MLKKIILGFLLASTQLFSQDTFISMCKNPTPEQEVVLQGMVNAKNEYREEYNKIDINADDFCEKIYEEFNSGFRAISGQNITDLSFLKYFPWVTRLDLTNNKITDITDIKYLTKLTELNLALNTIEKGIESLEKLPLKRLRLVLSKDDSIDLSPIGKIKTLEDFSLFYGENYEILNDLTNIKQLTLYYTPVEDLCKLKDLQSIKKLKLVGNNLKSLKCIENFKNLDQLTLERNPITDLTPLITLDNLTKISIREVPISDLSPLAEMKNLDSILFSKTKVKYLSPLAKSKTIEEAGDLSEMFFEEYFNRSLAGCSPKSMYEVREGKSCFEKDGTLKPFWKRWLRI